MYRHTGVQGDRYMTLYLGGCYTPYRGKLDYIAVLGKVLLPRYKKNKSHRATCILYPGRHNPTQHRHTPSLSLQTLPIVRHTAHNGTVQQSTAQWYRASREQVAVHRYRTPPQSVLSCCWSKTPSSNRFFLAESHASRTNGPQTKEQPSA